MEWQIMNNDGLNGTCHSLGEWIDGKYEISGDCEGKNYLLTLKAPPTICSRQHFQILLLYQKYQIRHDIS